MGQVKTRATTGGQVSGPVDFQALVHRLDGRVDVALQGELDYAATPVLVAAVAPLFSLDRVWLQADAAELSFIDASGIGCLVKIRSLLRAGGGGLVVHSASPLVRRVLGICGLTELLAGDAVEVA